MTQTLALAPLSRRIVALVIDWLMAVAISAGFFSYNEFATLGAFALMSVVLIGTIGGTIGHVIMGLGVRCLDGSAPGPTKALGRTVLLCLVLPGIFTMPDGRSYHDAIMRTTITKVR
ncbi:RDD family protein [Flaviflexus equikiangi]|uniref:RDD family protein n=1 Tax=Flaviflexus equikiangi TaxID=2758573 RepID=A0ABS2TF07_9ACTO|nr:RDD family protein [Flaviflexus equikiangi]MBM9433238.1 RDD family protein [Flaviflexus equikiangi]